MSQLNLDCLNYESRGNPDGPALLLVHGFLSSNAQWRPNIEALGQHFRLLLAELWGHGDSPLPAEDRFSIDSYLSAFDEIRRIEGIDQWGLIGQSYAAGLVIRYAVNHPQQTTGIVVTNSSSAFGDIETARRGRSSHKDRPEERDDNRHMPIHPIYARRLPDDVKAALVSAADNTPADAVRLGGRLAGQLKAVDLVSDLQAPLLLTNGRFEKTFQPVKDSLLGQYPDLLVQDMAGGHAVNIEAADEFNEAVLSFFQHQLNQATA